MPASGPSIVDCPSPNHGDRKPVGGVSSIALLVLHYTGMQSTKDALARLCDPAAQVSAHYLVDEDGIVYGLVPEERRAWHAGVSYWQGQRDINSLSIGIEIANPGHECGYRSFAEPQIEAVCGLAADILARRGIAADGVVGHSDIAPGRKIDPGEMFPWPRLAAQGIGVWPDLTGTHRLLAADDAYRLLSAIGYATPLSADLGADLLGAPQDCIAAFQRHYRPRRIDGLLDGETLALIQARAAACA